ncbi:MAG: Na+/H+ antiporter subunit E [Parachlamydiaceae bacterium]
MKPFLINLALAFVWLMLGSITLWRLLIGYALGFIILSFFPNIQGNECYIKRTFAFFKFSKKFFIEFIKANFSVAKIVLFKPKKELIPRFIHYDISQLTKVEVLILNQCITLTPGTVTVQLASDHSSLLIHVLSADSGEEVRHSIKNDLEIPLLEFTRC